MGFFESASWMDSIPIFSILRIVIKRKSGLQFSQSMFIFFISGLIVVYMSIDVIIK